MLFFIKKYRNDYQFVYESLNKGKALVMNTDTVIGLLSKNKAILYDIKKRPLKKKLFYS